MESLLLPSTAASPACKALTSIAAAAAGAADVPTRIWKQPDEDAGTKGSKMRSHLAQRGAEGLLQHLKEAEDGEGGGDGQAGTTAGAVRRACRCEHAPLRKRVCACVCVHACVYVCVRLCVCTRLCMAYARGHGDEACCWCKRPGMSCHGVPYKLASTCLIQHKLIHAHAMQIAVAAAV